MIKLNKNKAKQNSAVGAAVALRSYFYSFRSFCYADTVCVRFRSRVSGPDRLYFDVYFTARCYTTYEYVCVYYCLLLLCSVFCYTAVAAAAACWVRCTSSCARWLNLFPWFAASASGVFFLFIQTRFLSMYPLAVLSHLQGRFSNLWHISYILGITGMLGAKAGVSPPRRSHPVLYIFVPLFSMGFSTSYSFSFFAFLVPGKGFININSITWLSFLFPS